MADKEKYLRERQEIIDAGPAVGPDRGGRPKLTVQDLLDTETLVRTLGHHGAAAELGIGYHAVRGRMRRLLRMRDLPVYKRGKRIKMGDI
jgi:hypothetical protein